MDIERKISEQVQADQLSRIAKLHAEGKLSDEEFERLKAGLLKQPPQPPPRPNFILPEWYYLQGDEQVGPVFASDLKSFRHSRQIGPRTRVWRRGMADWVPLEECGAIDEPMPHSPRPAEPRGAEMGSGEGVSELTIADKLSRIAKLHSDGVLSKEEFQTLKAKLLEATTGDPPSSSTVDDEWYYLRGDEQLGPISLAELRMLLFSRQINQDTLVWRRGMPDRIAVGRCHAIMSKPSARVNRTSSHQRAPSPDLTRTEAPPNSSLKPEATPVVVVPDQTRPKPKKNSGVRSREMNLLLIAAVILTIAVDQADGPIFPDGFYCAIGAGREVTSGGEVSVSSWSANNGCGPDIPGCATEWTYSPSHQYCAHGTIWDAIKYSRPVMRLQQLFTNG